MASSATVTVTAARPNSPVNTSTENDTRATAAISQPTPVVRNGRGNGAGLPDGRRRRAEWGITPGPWLSFTTVPGSSSEGTPMTPPYPASVRPTGVPRDQPRIKPYPPATRHPEHQHRNTLVRAMAPRPNGIDAFSRNLGRAFKRAAPGFPTSGPRPVGGGRRLRDAWSVRSTSGPWSHSLPTTWPRFEPVAGWPSSGRTFSTGQIPLTATVHDSPMTGSLRVLSRNCLRGLALNGPLGAAMELEGGRSVPSA